ncbi:MAG TPA: C40 family peptidase [Chloroflexota bacterium]|nr:C40 family peptidase [Chloroflexota bacterium]
MLAWGSRNRSATEYLSWRPFGLRILVASFIATLALLGIRSVALPAMAAPAAAILNSPSCQTAPEEASLADEAAGITADEAQSPAVEPPVDEFATDPEAGDSTQERITPTSRGGARPSDSASPAADSQTRGDRIASIAQKYVGYGYRWAGMSPRTGFDCSGLMGYVYQEAGISVPLHSLAGMLNSGKRVNRDQLRAGDMVFFENTWQWGLSHGGIYIGNGEFVHAESEGVGVVISDLDAYNWISHFVGGSRPW